MAELDAAGDALLALGEPVPADEDGVAGRLEALTGAAGRAAEDGRADGAADEAYLQARATVIAATSRLEEAERARQGLADVVTLRRREAVARRELDGVERACLQDGRALSLAGPDADAVLCAVPATIAAAQQRFRELAEQTAQRSALQARLRDVEGSGKEYARQLEECRADLSRDDEAALHARRVSLDVERESVAAAAVKLYAGAVAVAREGEGANGAVADGAAGGDGAATGVLVADALPDALPDVTGLRSALRRRCDALQGDVAVLERQAAAGDEAAAGLSAAAERLTRLGRDLAAALVAAGGAAAGGATARRKKNPAASPLRWTGRRRAPPRPSAGAAGRRSRRSWRRWTSRRRGRTSRRCSACPGRPRTSCAPQARRGCAWRPRCSTSPGRPGTTSRTRRTRSPRRARRRTGSGAGARGARGADRNRGPAAPGLSGRGGRSAHARGDGRAAGGPAAGGVGGGAGGGRGPGAAGRRGPAPLAEAAAALAETELDLAARRRTQDILGQTRQRMINKVLPDTMRNMCLLLPLLTAGRYRYAELTPDYRLQVWDERKHGYVEKSLYSGGTQDQFSLALRLGFALAALPRELGTSPGFLFLDEPLSSFDHDRTAALIDLLTHGQIATFFQQVFLISHSQAFDPSRFTHHIVMEEGGVAHSTLHGAPGDASGALREALAVQSQP